jgi:PAS domain S-box-containing protein
MPKRPSPATAGHSRKPKRTPLGALQQRIQALTAAHAALETELARYRRAEIERPAADDTRARNLFDYAAFPVWEEDFSEVKAYFDELRAAGIQDFRAYFEAHPEATANCAARVNVVDINQTSVDFFQAQSKAEVVHDVPTYFTPDSWPVFKEEMIALANGQSEFESEIPIRAPSGQTRWLLLRLRVPPYCQDSLKQVLVSFFDITKRRQAEAALAESERRYRLLTENANALIGEFDLEGRFTYANAAYEPILGYAPGELIGRSAGDLLHSDDAEAANAALAALLTDGKPSLNIWRFKDSAGAWHWFECTGNVFRTASGDLRLVVVSTDISERQQIEDKIRQLNTELEARVVERTAELSAANAALLRAAQLKDSFMASMSHELRTPLTGVLGLSEALQMGVYGPLAKNQLQALQFIRESGQHLLALITDILDLSKLEAGKEALQAAPVEIESVCEASLLFVKQTAQKKKLRLSVTYDPQVEIILADARRLKQMLANLLSNAVKFTPPGGQVGLDVVGKPEQHAVHFVVWDTGIGIAPEKQGQLFKPFTQLDNRLAREFEGAGLGLSLVMRMAELHGGSVGVESDGLPGHGSRFTLSLPWQTPTSALPLAPLPPEADRLADGAGQTILVVDDNEITLNTLSDFLQAHGYHVELARQGAEAMERAPQLLPAVVLLDIQMPGIDGLEVLRRWRAGPDPKLAAIPIIALTALAMPGDQERCLAAGATAYLVKPVRLQELSHWLNRLTRS